MPSAIADTSESLPYSFAKDLRKACDAALARRDPKGAKAAKANSSYARGQRSALRQASDVELLNELMRRQKALRKRKGAAERMRKWRRIKAAARR